MDLLSNQRELLQELGLSSEEVPAIAQSAQISVQAVERAREFFILRNPLEAGTDLVAFGSLARYELTEMSDLDYLFVSTGDKEATIPDGLIAELSRHLVDKVILSGPGTSNLFGRSILSEELVEKIGLQDDTNMILTRRVLFLEESVSLARPELHQEVLRQILDRYVNANPDSPQLPRFLLNDIIRYWRTIAIDYQAKAEGDKPKALRYLKLLIPRKLCFVAAIAPLFLLQSKEDLDPDGKLEFLAEQYARPSLLRLLELLVELSRDDDNTRVLAVRVVKTLDSFIENSGQEKWRELVEVEALVDDPKGTPNYGVMRKNGKDLHETLGALFMSERMKKFTTDFMVL